MPKIVDHAERRRSIARGFTDHAATHGVVATTYARLARELGCSVGTIQHYFSSREELVRAAFTGLLAERDARIDAIVERGEAQHRSIREMVASAMTELLPLDAVRRHEHVVVHQLRVASAVDTHLASVLAEADDALHRRVATGIANGVLCGEVADDVETDVAASRILATTHGLALAPAVLDDRDAILGPVLSQVFSGRCRRHG